LETPKRIFEVSMQNERDKGTPNSKNPTKSTKLKHKSSNRASVQNLENVFMDKRKHQLVKSQKKKSNKVNIYNPNTSVQEETNSVFFGGKRITN
jgi:hypothetical protein